MKPNMSKFSREPSRPDFRKVVVSEWAKEHASDVKSERRARSDLRSAVLGILCVTEADLSGDAIVVKAIQSSDVRDNQGELFYDVYFSASSTRTWVTLIHPSDPKRSPQGWEMGPNSKGHLVEADPNECMDQVLGTEIQLLQPLDDTTGAVSARWGQRYLREYMDMVTSHPEVYDFEGATTELLPRNQ